MSKSRSRLYVDGRVADRDLEPAAIAEAVRDGSNFGWIDLPPSDGEAISAVSNAVGVSPNTFAAAEKGHYRPTVHHLKGQVVLSLPVLKYDKARKRIQTRGIVLVVTRNLLITANLAGTSLASDVQSVWDAWEDSAASKHLAAPGGLLLVHGLMISYLDSLTDVVDRVDQLVETLEDRFLEDETVGPALHDARRRAGHALSRVRAVVALLPSIVDTLGYAAMTMGHAGYFDDLDRRVDRLLARTEVIREVVLALLEVEQAAQGNRLNQVMRRLSAVAAIFATVTAITGYYGMNIRTWPAAGSTVGGLVVLLATISLTVLLAFVFRRNGWL
jgi:magnesium transporter